MTEQPELILVYGEKLPPNHYWQALRLAAMKQEIANRPGILFLDFESVWDPEWILKLIG